MGPSDFIVTQQAAAKQLVANRTAILQIVSSIPANISAKQAALTGFLSQSVPGLGGPTYQEAMAAIAAWEQANPTNPSVPSIAQTMQDLQAQLAMQTAYVTALAQAITAAVASVPVPAGL